MFIFLLYYAGGIFLTYYTKYLLSSGIFPLPIMNGFLATLYIYMMAKGIFFLGQNTVTPEESMAFKRPDFWKFQFIQNCISVFGMIFDGFAFSMISVSLGNVIGSTGTAWTAFFFWMYEDCTLSRKQCLAIVGVMVGAFLTVMETEKIKWDGVEYAIIALIPGALSSCMTSQMMKQWPFLKDPLRMNCYTTGMFLCMYFWVAIYYDGKQFFQIIVTG